MHRIRQSISYYKDYGWLAEVVVVDSEFININKDAFLLEAIPNDIIIHKIKAFDEHFTRKLGLGNIAFRSIYYYFKYVNSLLRKSDFDLIFFSTTAFPLTILGQYWKWKFNIPYVIDFQDPWRSDHYLNLPKSQRPPKFWFSYYLDSFLEKHAVKKVNGLMAVSKNYLDVLVERYPHLNKTPKSVIPFAAFKKDIDTARKHTLVNNFFDPNSKYFNIVYVGRGGYDMVYSCTLFLKAIKRVINRGGEFEDIRCFFIGTSYDTKDNVAKIIFTIAKELEIEKYIFEQTQRIPYFESLKVLNDADLLFVPGSDNIGYTASKIYQYVWFNKPMLTLFHSSSSVNDFVNECNAGIALKFDEESDNYNISRIESYILDSIIHPFCHVINWDQFSKYTAESRTKLQIELFNKAIK